MAPHDGRAQQRAWLSDGEVVSGRLIGTTGATLRFQPDSQPEPISVSRIRQIGFEGAPCLPAGPQPQCRLVLHGEEVIPAQWIGSDARHVALSFPGAQSLKIPRAAVKGILQPTGEQLRLHDDFETPRSFFRELRTTEARSHGGRKSLDLPLEEASTTCLLSRPVTAGRLDLAFYDDGSQDPAHEWLVICEFGRDDRKLRWSFHPVSSSGGYRCTASAEIPLASQSVARSRGWHRYTFLFGRERIFALVDGRMISTSRGIGYSLLSIRLEWIGSTNAAGNMAEEEQRATDDRHAGIDDFLLMERVDDAPIPRGEPRQDLVWLAGDDELFGNVPSASPFDVLLGRERLEWSAVRGIVFQRADAPEVTAVSGVIATVELAPTLGGPASHSGRLYGALTEADGTALRVHHPLLGPLTIPCAIVARVEPHFTGTWQSIDPACRHFGDEIREDFQEKVPEGTEREWSFTLKAVPRGNVFLHLFSADLEPGAADAPRAGRYRSELEKGALRTELVLNGRPFDTLNRHVRLKADPQNPERLRISIPLKLLSAGTNRLVLRQHPAHDEPGEFDDCEISQLGLEIE